MKLIRTALFFTILAYSVWFCLSNFAAVELTIPLIMQISVSLFIVILLSLTIGIFIGYFLYSITSLRHSIKTREVKKEADILKSKLDIYETEKKIREQLGNN